MYMIAWMEVFILVIKMYILHFENIHLVNCWKSIRITTLGCYNTKEEAELSFIKARKEYVEKTLKKYENKIPLEIYDKLKKGCYNEFEN